MLTRLRHDCGEGGGVTNWQDIGAESNRYGARLCVEYKAFHDHVTHVVEKSSKSPGGLCV
jgi:hypothetical protein